MNSNYEKWVLEQALREGILDKNMLEHLDKIEDPPDELVHRYGPRLARLIVSNMVTEAWISQKLQAVQRLNQSPEVQTSSPDDIATQTMTTTLSSDHVNSESVTIKVNPFKDWDRYDVLEFIGHGGMGYVLKARDPKLNRLVAIKILMGERQEQVQRFLQEARSQARIIHPNVCRIYEVGTYKGHHYIAMQYIDGYTLESMYPQLPLETRIQIIRDIAQAVHEAHRLGIIHRDIKPSNIMLERHDGGTWHPYIMDFGLARPIHEPGLTVSGAVVGTPYYMAPEQAQGNSVNVDRRTDVYGLGATLYHIVCGKRPFDDRTGFEVLMAVMNDEPEQPRKVNPHIPRDVETIILKAMSKDPSRRYATARELAEDLTRFLNGDPISARAPSLAYRLWMRLRKNPSLTISMFMTTLLVLSLLGFTIYTRIKSSQMTRFAQEFGERIKEAENILRIGYLMPLHDIRREYRMVRRKIQEIRAQLNEVPDYASGPAMTALGRLYLLLGEPEKALEHLKEAEKTGYTSPQLNLAMGLALSQLYSQELNRLHRIEDETSKREILKNAISRYRIPALNRLREAESSITESKAYTRALIHYVNAQYEQALSLVDQAINEEPWPYAPLQLKANILKEIALLHQYRGDYIKAKNYFSNAEKTYQMAANIARSYPVVYLDWCELYVNEINFYLWNLGEDPTPLSKKAEKICTRASLANPELLNPHLLLSRAYALTGNFKVWQQEDSSPYFQKAVDLAQWVIDHSSSSISSKQEAHEIIADIMEIRAYIAWENGEDARNFFERAIQEYKKALPHQPLPRLFNSLAVTYSGLASYLFDIGENSLDYIDEALRYHHQTLTFDRENPVYLSNLASSYLLRAQLKFESNLDYQHDLKKASEYINKVLHINPSDPYSLLYYAKLNLLKARVALSRNHPIENLIREGLEAIQQAVSINKQFKPFTMRVEFQLRILDLCYGTETLSFGNLLEIHQEVESFINKRKFIQRDELLADLSIHTCAIQHGWHLPSRNELHQSIKNRFLSLYAKARGNTLLEQYASIMNVLD